jgi:crotonobetainyl-CoA:carnitine CoA-transferase CaiB-like acyl-CoA transferase
MTAGVLDGIHVIDCAEGLAGSVAALMLAEVGAEVVKVEPPGGNALRGTARFAAWNRSKKSIALDIAESDRSTFDGLLAKADILIHDWPSEAAEEAGLDTSSLARRAPHLITSWIRGLPDGMAEGPLPTDDDLVTAAMGVMSEQAALFRDGPTYLRFPLGSWCAAWLAVTGIAARLFCLRKGGAAGAVDTSLLQGAFVPLMMLWRTASTPTETFDARIAKTNLPSIFECGDGVWLHIMANADDTPLMKRCLEEMGPAAVAKANAGYPPHHRYHNWGANVAAFRSHSSAVWLEALWASDIPAQRVGTMGELYGDAQALANGYVVEVDDPDLGRVRQPGPPITITPPARIRGPSPRLDADRDEVLRGSMPVRRVVSGTAKPLLNGITVVDFGNYAAGPLATMLLADLGATVIKVEAITGDPMRSNESAFLACQRGKRSLALDLRNPDAKQIVSRLVERADIVHHNMRMPAATRLGLDYDRLRAIKPDLIYGHVSAYGPQGERRDWPGYDQLFQASTGWEKASAGEGNPPTWLRFGMMDHLCATASAYTLILALIRRQMTGEGSAVAASLLGTSIMTMSEVAMRADGSLTAGALPLNSDQSGVSPGRRIVRCRDGWIAVVGEDAAVEGVADESCETALAMLNARPSVRAVRARDDASRAFLNDEVNNTLGLVARYRHPVYGDLRHPGAFWTMSDVALRLDRAPPTIGQHSIELLDELGFSTEEIETFIAQKLVRAA